MVHPDLVARKFAADVSRYVCIAALHFIHTDLGAFVGGCVGATEVLEVLDVGDTPLPNALDANWVVGVEQMGGVVPCTMVHSAAIR